MLDLTPFRLLNNIGMLDLSSFRRNLEKALDRYHLSCDGRIVQTLLDHASAVMQANDRLHLTSLRDPESFMERHLEESLVGATVVTEDRSGVMLDLGSGNGYPGVPLAVLRPRLRPILVEASVKKAAFLSQLTRLRGLERLEVYAEQVQRAADLPEDPVSIDLLVSRAMGNWERVVPRLHDRLADEAQVLIWAGDEAPKIFARGVWRDRFVNQRSLPLPGRDRARLWILTKRPV